MLASLYTPGLSTHEMIDTIIDTSEAFICKPFLDFIAHGRFDLLAEVLKMIQVTDEMSVLQLICTKRSDI